MNTKKTMRFHDPKIEPPPGESVEVTLEYTKEELRVIDEAVREGGFWSREEFFRAAAAEFIKEYRGIQ
jgi:metal-responsive CopG/Arc/MetJ family transcriptional regulator